MAGVLKRLIQGQSGEAVVHYGLIVAGTAAAILAVVAAHGLK